jgi:sigma-E factor negative regulatory protein RseB
VTGPFSGWRVASTTVALVLLAVCAVALTLRHSGASRLAGDRAKPAGTPGTSGATPAARSPLVSKRLTAEELTAERLMTQAAAAASGTAYSGVQVSDWWGPSGLSSSVLDVWHRPGGGVVAQALAASGVSGSDPDGTDMSVSRSGDPVVTMTLTGKQLRLLLANYQLDYAGAGSAGGRPAEVVTVRRHGGALAARFWLDRQTKLLLRREIFAGHSDLVSNISLIDLKLGAHAVAEMPAAGAQPWTRQLDAHAIAALRSKGWPVLPRLAGGLRLFTASEAHGSSGPVIDMSYSDGLSVVSIFVQRGYLPHVLQGWQRVAIGGHHAFTSDPDDRTIAWSSSGFVFTMIADAPAGTVDQAVATLARDHEPSFWARLGRGFKRLATLAHLFR